MFKFLTTLLILFSPAVVSASDIWKTTCLVRTEPSITDAKCGGSGSGFFVGDNRVITACHVIEPVLTKGTKVRIEYYGTNYEAKVVKYDRLYDLALLDVSVENENVVNIADKEPIKEDKLFCNGYPKGVWTNHTSTGPLRERRKWVKLDKSSLFKYMINANILPGMSGGPIVDGNGDIVGVIIERHTSASIAYGSVLSQLKSFLEGEIKPPVEPVEPPVEDEDEPELKLEGPSNGNND